MRKKMVLCLTWYAKEMEPKRNYLNCTRKMVKLVQLFEESKSCRGKCKVAKHDSLHKGSNCEMETLVERLDGNASQPSWAWLGVLNKKRRSERSYKISTT
jgi:hypothetical protein